MMPASLTAAEARAILESVAERFGKCWPLKSYIAANPLIGYEDRPFFAALAAAVQDGVWQTPLSARHFAPFFRQGQIDKSCLHRRFLAQIAEFGLSPAATPDLCEILWADLLADLDDTPDVPPSAALCQAVATIPVPTTGENPAPVMAPDGLMGRIDALSAVWCAAYLDEGQAAWKLPGRAGGLLAAWRGLADQDPTLRGAERQALRRVLADLPHDSNSALAAMLNQNGQDSQQYLLAQMARIPGWVGYIRWKAAHPDARQIDRAKSALVDLMVIRLCYAAVLMPVSVPASPVADPGDLRHHLLCRLARTCGNLPVAEADLCAVLDRDGPDVLRVLAQFGPLPKAQIALEALEDSQRAPLLAQLADTARGGVSHTTPTPLLAQAVFCIDVRSEPFRRALEQASPHGAAIATLGFAGFFGIPMRFRPFAEGAAQDLCPVLLHPRYEIEETPHDGHAHCGARLARHQRALRQVRALLMDLKSSVTATFGMVETTGIFYGLTALARTLRPRGFRVMMNRIIRRVAPPVPLRPVLSGCGHTVTSGLAHGLTDAEQAFFAETALSMMGLTFGFAPLVLLCGHGCATENNPYSAALDCGACGGNPGGANARVLAAILNRDVVRAALATRGIVIPAETVFLAGEHNTTTDSVTIFDADAVPALHHDRLAALETALATAAVVNGQRRQNALPGGDDPHRNAADWSQVRPEWGLAGNAFFIIGPRSLTASLDLDGRAFLHSFDHTQDPEGKALEVILTAPLVVTEWINMQYLFSTLDNDRFGSGTKITHNVVGKFGILQGNTGDLQIGLPLQSVMRADGSPYHIPVRLLAVVVAPVAQVRGIIARHAILQRFFNHGWVALTVIEPDSGKQFQYKPGGVWEACAPPEATPAPDLPALTPTLV